MNKFFKIHKVKILTGNDNFKFLGAFIRPPFPLFYFSKSFSQSKKKKKSSIQAGA